MVVAVVAIISIVARLMLLSLSYSLLPSPRDLQNGYKDNGFD